MLQPIEVSASSYGQTGAAIARQEADPRILSALRFIDGNYGRPSLGLKDISQSAGLSVWHFSRLFNAGMRVGLREHLKNVRLAHACKLLRANSLSIKEVAAAVGYTHLSDFYHHFKREHGISPLVFRRSAHRNGQIVEMATV